MKPQSPIAIIVTIKKVADAARQIVADAGGGIPVYQCYWDNAVRVAAELAARGVKIIISMGLTARMIKKETALPVIEIQYSGLECLAALEQAWSHSERVAVLGSESMRHQMRRVAAHTGRELPIFELFPDTPPREQVQALIDRGFEVVISGSPSSDIANELGVVGVNLLLDSRMIGIALESARDLLALMNEAEEKSQTIAAILDSTSEGILCADRHGKVTYVNPAAERMLGRPARKMANIGVEEILPVGESGGIIAAETGSGEEPGLIVTGKKPIRVEGKESGSVYVIREVSEIQRLEMHIRRELLAKGHFAKSTFRDIIGDSEALRKAMRIAEKYARYDSTVLICGESGTGKEMFAQSIHNASKRRAEAFVTVNCAAIPESLLESELFGYVKGAFTGARADGRSGVFEMAHKGTIFLDEIGELPLPMQTKLLRVLQENEITRIGDDKVVKIDVRVLCATNQNLLEMVEKGQFREDLYYRLHVLELMLPPLRDRAEDIVMLARAIVAQKNARLGTAIKGLTPELEDRLAAQSWKGNIRQLGNFLERMIVVSEKDVLDADLLDTLLPEGRPETTAVAEAGALQQSEESMIREVMRQTGGNRKQAAAILGIGTSTLWRKLKRMDADM